MAETIDVRCPTTEQPIPSDRLGVVMIKGVPIQDHEFVCPICGQRHVLNAVSGYAYVE